ncbi:glycosyltransferase family 2 protein [Sphingomonas rubra]|uniref:Glycosyl transferase family group 2 n=1 Tax=Sphingomonas rubra TaxID=634430 RepID=A0A1I5SI14_9SPHN|nr:Glycosyl transferase family group 2 [Sphingomonas rubra]
MVVRTALGAGMPLAGTGCAMAPDMLRRIAAARGGDPFDSDSLVEDYELGLRIAEFGGRALFARVDDASGATVAVRAYFPDTVDAAVRQKARWMTGIALAGWDRTGWARPLALPDHWMRARDRRAPLAVLVLAAAYLALVLWGVSAVSHWLAGTQAQEPSDGVAALLPGNAVLLLWRIGMRAAITRQVYGWREACWSVPRLLVGNYIALLAARRAVWRYVTMLRGGAVTWDKTQHHFPDVAAIDATKRPTL